MPTVQKDVTIDAAAHEVWRIAGDPGRIAPGQEEELVQTFDELYGSGLEALKPQAEQG